MKWLATTVNIWIIAASLFWASVLLSGYGFSGTFKMVDLIPVAIIVCLLWPLSVITPYRVVSATLLFSLILGAVTLLWFHLHEGTLIWIIADFALVAKALMIVMHMKREKELPT